MAKAPLIALEEESQPGQDRLERYTRESPHSLVELDLVYSDNLRHIHHARSRQAGITFSQCNVSRRGSAVHVGRDQADHRCGDTAVIEDVALHDDTGVPLGRRGARGRAKVEPVYVALADLFHQRSLSPTIMDGELRSQFPDQTPLIRAGPIRVRLIQLLGNPGSRPLPQVVSQRLSNQSATAQPEIASGLVCLFHERVVHRNCSLHTLGYTTLHTEQPACLEGYWATLTKIKPTSSGHPRPPEF